MVTLEGNEVFAYEEIMLALGKMGEDSLGGADLPSFSLSSLTNYISDELRRRLATKEKVIHYMEREGIIAKEGILHRATPKFYEELEKVKHKEMMI